MTSTEALTLFDNDLQPARFHREDPWTSKAAARTVAVTAGTARFAVLAALADAAAGGLTDYELGARLGIQTTTAGTRRGELAAAGLVETTDRRRPTDTNALARVHVITVAGDARFRAELRRGTAPSGPQRPQSGARPPGRTIDRRPGRYGLPELRHRILEELHRRGDLTDEQLGEAIGVLRTAAGTERLRLVEAGHVIDAGEVRRTASGHRARCWRITQAGVRELTRAIARARADE